MTENEIIKDLECCSQKKCSNCSRIGIVGCSDILAKDAYQVIKLQKDHLKDVQDTINRLESAAKFDFSLKDLVSRLNEVIEESIAHGGDSGGAYFCNWHGFMRAVSSLLQLIDKGNELVLTVDKYEDAKIQFKK